MSSGAAAAAQAAKGASGGGSRSLRRRDSYVSFLETHNPSSLDHLKQILNADTPQKQTTQQIVNEKALPGLDCIQHRKCVHCCMVTRDNKYFQISVIGVIFAAGILVGIQTYPIEKGSQLARTLHSLDVTVLWIFVLEIVVKFIAEGKTPWLFFTDSWNVFDFFIVAVGFLPIGGGGSVTVLRLLRLLRVLKLVKALPNLRILVIGLIKSFSSIAYIGVLLMLQFFLFAVLAVSVFGENDPVHLGTLHIALLTLFRCATLEDWTDVMYIGMYGCKNYGYDGLEDQCVKSTAFGIVAALYWVVFIMLATFMILNLFIGVITSSMQEAKEELIAEAQAEAEAAKEKDDDDVVGARLSQIAELLETMHTEIEELGARERERGSSKVIHIPRKASSRAAL